MRASVSISSSAGAGRRRWRWCPAIYIIFTRWRGDGGGKSHAESGTSGSPKGEGGQPTTHNSERTHYTMKSELGLLWIPVGFLLMIGAVAALFLTVMPS